ncbi:MAG: pyridoxamine 5'-phosphate oxidase [Proteobacteria bacterium]|nr:pyridoxamine 5'-phosphate oxidase [Pseudomonadota bacterium]
MDRQYLYGRLDQVASDPFDQFDIWFNQACMDMPLKLVNSMVLATTSNNFPSARVVLLKEYSPEGLVFYTNYLSRKGCEISENPNVSLLFWWEAHERQVRIEGIAEKISHERSEAYFHTRPKFSQIAAMASKQSKPLENLQDFQSDYQTLLEQYASAEISLPCPENWGGYLIKPKLFEFWQGRENRLHDRFQFKLDTDGNWKISRLYP